MGRFSTGVADLVSLFKRQSNETVLTLISLTICDIYQPIVPVCSNASISIDPVLWRHLNELQSRHTHIIEAFPGETYE